MPTPPPQMEPPPGQRFLTTAQAAAQLQCSRSHVHVLIDQGVLPAWKVSPRKTLIPVGALARIEDALLAGVSDAALARAVAVRSATKTAAVGRTAAQEEVRDDGAQLLS